MRNRVRFIGTFAGLCALVAASAAGPVDPVNKSGKGLALKGYDPVGYFTDSQPVKGSAEFAHDWMGAEWRFASVENRDRFAADPARYAPQYGGYCAWAVSNNYTADADPEAWKIVDGKLYLNYSKGVQKKWEKDQAQRIEAADANWPRLHK
ncbi:MAG: YHS domain-containing protein [Bryobacteraceae bacterium]|nr:YHS domain-containing protein [Bryobacteraceae bacterium]